MIRINVETRTAGQVVLELAGQLTVEHGALLQREVTAIMTDPRQAILDVTHVRAISPPLLEQLARWSRQGLQIRGGSLFVRTLLQAHGIASLDAPSSSPEAPC